MRASRSKVIRENSKLKAENVKIQRSLWKTRKELQKLKSKDLSPRSKVNRIARGKKISPDVKKKLLFGEVLSRQLGETVNKLKSKKVKQVAHRLLNGSIIKRYKMLKNCKNILSLHCLTKYRQDKPLSSLDVQRSENKRKTTNVQKIRDFFLREDVSSECPDKKAYKIQFGKNRVKMRSIPQRSL